MKKILISIIVGISSFLIVISVVLVNNNYNTKKHYENFQQLDAQSLLGYNFSGVTLYNNVVSETWKNSIISHRNKYILYNEYIDSNHKEEDGKIVHRLTEWTDLYSFPALIYTEKVNNGSNIISTPNIVVDLNNALKDHDAVSYGYVIKYITIPVKESCEQKMWFNNWFNIDSTKKTGYNIYNFKSEFLTYLYRDKIYDDDSNSSHYVYGYGNVSTGYTSLEKNDVKAYSQYKALYYPNN